MGPEGEQVPAGALHRLRSGLEESRGEYAGESGPTPGGVIEPLGSEGAASGVTLLALPLLSPIGIGGLTAPASLVIAVLGLPVLRELERPALPKRLSRLRIPRTAHAGMLTVLDRFDHPLRRQAGLRSASPPFRSDRRFSHGDDHTRRVNGPPLRDGAASRPHSTQSPTPHDGTCPDRRWRDIHLQTPASRTQ